MWKCSVSSLCHEETLPWDETLTLAELPVAADPNKCSLLDRTLVSLLCALLSTRPQLWPTMSMFVHAESSFSKNPATSVPILS